VEYVCGKIKKFLEFSRIEIIMLPVEVKGVLFVGVDCVLSVEEVRIG
jgi:hypothetical protein